MRPVLESGGLGSLLRLVRGPRPVRAVRATHAGRSRVHDAQGRGMGGAPCVPGGFRGHQGHRAASTWTPDPPGDERCGVSGGCGRVSGTAFGLAAMDQPLEDFTDYVLTDAQAAKMCGLALKGWLELKRDRPPLSMFRDDLARYAKALKAGESNRWRR